MDAFSFGEMLKILKGHLHPDAMKFVTLYFLYLGMFALTIGVLTPVFIFMGFIRKAIWDDGVSWSGLADSLLIIALLLLFFAVALTAARIAIVLKAKRLHQEMTDMLEEMKALKGTG